MMRNRGSIFSVLPKEVTDYIIHGVPAFDPKSDVAKLLQYVAYGDPVKVKEMLDTNPRLLIEAGNVVAPSGDTILRVTLMNVHWVQAEMM